MRCAWHYRDFGYVTAYVAVYPSCFNNGFKSGFKKMLKSSGSLFVFLLLMFVSLSALADINPLARMEGLVMPGDVIKKHARIEKQCDKCHAGFDRLKQNKQCMDCHKEIASDVKKPRGFHGKIIGVNERECRSCHSDHLGRDADIIQLDTELFNHNDTEFKLAGAHKSIDCKTCHKVTGVYRIDRKSVV